MRNKLKGYGWARFIHDKLLDLMTLQRHEKIISTEIASMNVYSLNNHLVL